MAQISKHVIFFVFFFGFLGWLPVSGMSKIYSQFYEYSFVLDTLSKSCSKFIYDTFLSIPYFFSPTIVPNMTAPEGVAYNFEFPYVGSLRELYNENVRLKYDPRRRGKHFTQ